MSAKVHLGNISRLMSEFTFDNGYLFPMAASRRWNYGRNKIWRGKCDISLSFVIILQFCSITDPVSISEVNNLPRLMRIHTFHIVGAYTWLAG